MIISAKVESEIATLRAMSATEFLELSVSWKTGLDRMIRVGYESARPLTFFTVGPKETHAWTVTKGTARPGGGRHPHRFEQGFMRV